MYMTHSKKTSFISTPLNSLVSLGLLMFGSAPIVLKHIYDVYSALIIEHV